MSIPSGIGTATVHIDAPVSYTGDPGRVHINITASVPLVWAATGTPLANFMDSFTPGAGTEMTALLPWTDQAGFIDGAGNTYTNWSYLAQITYEKDGQLVVFPDRSFQIPSGQTSVDLALVPAGPSVPAQTAPILPVTSVNGRNGAVVLTKTDVGLANADNTSDVNKPVSTAAQTALNVKLDTWMPGVNYAVGKVVISPGGVLVKAKTAHLSGAVFSGIGTNWASVDLGQAVLLRTNLSTNPSMETASGTVNTRVNLCTNPNMEAGIAGWAAKGTPTVSASTTVAWNGTQSLKVVSNGATEIGAGITIAGLTIGLSYTMSGYVYIPTSSGASAVIATVTTIGYGTITTLKDQWVRLSYTFTATATSHQFGFNNSNTFASGQIFYVDGFLIEQTTLLLPYFDGANPIQNLIANPDFETDLTGWTVENGATLVRDTVSPIGGVASGKFVGGAGLGDVYAILSSFNQGVVYTFSVDYKAPVAPGGAQKIGIIELGGTARAWYTNLPSVQSSAARFSVSTLPVGAGVTSIIVVLFSDTNTQPVWFDNILVEASPGAAYYKGQGDFTHSWSSTANASTSIQQAPGVAGAGYTSSIAFAFQSIVRGATGGTKSLRIIPTSTNNDSFADITGLFVGYTLKPNTTYTLAGDRTLAAPLTGSLNGNQGFRLNTGSDLPFTYSTAPANVAGTTRVVATFATGASTGINFFRLYNGASASNGDVWWDRITLEEGVTTGAYFDGASTSGGDVTYAWTGGANASSSTMTSTSLALAPLDSPTFTGTVGGITKAMVGLGNVDNTSDANKPLSTADVAALALKAPIASPTFTGTVGGITATMVGLGNVTNTSDANKPVSTAQQTALNLKADLAGPTFTGTVGGITKSMVGLGNVDNTADTAKPVSTAQQTALNLKADLASPAFTGTPTGITKTHVGLGNVDNTSDVNKPVSTATSTLVTPMAKGVIGQAATAGVSAAIDGTTTIVGDYAAVSLVNGRWYRASYKFNDVCAGAANVAMAITMLKSVTTDTTNAGSGVDDAMTMYTPPVANQGGSIVAEFVWKAGTTETVNIKACLLRAAGSSTFTVSNRHLIISDLGANI